MIRPRQLTLAFLGSGSPASRQASRVNRPPLQPKPPSLTEPQAAPPTGQRIAKPTRRRP